MFYNNRIKRMEKSIDNMADKIIDLERELKEKTTIRYPLGGCITWFQSNVLVKDVVKDIVKEMGYRINHQTTEEVNTYIEKKPKRKKVKK